MVSHKETILYSEQVQFNEKLKPETVTIKSKHIDLDQGGVLQVNVYRVSEDLIAYAEYLNLNGYDYDVNNTNVEGGKNVDTGKDDN
mmetsp:Transcript_22301/g.16767  ORF Transcript_22301/g.16767 Transcript_22301/m.16767 type:complete len:86 (+) Transcript_22301:1469-1726(+)